MRAVVQRVSEASVEVDGSVTGSISKGLLIYLGVCRGDKKVDADYLVEKITGLRIYEDTRGKMNLSVQETGGSLLVVSQFTLCADVRKGKRPSYNMAAPPEEAHMLYEYFVEQSRIRVAYIQTGIFQASMQVRYTNEGPITIMVDSRKEF